MKGFIVEIGVKHGMGMDLVTRVGVSTQFHLVPHVQLPGKGQRYGRTRNQSSLPAFLPFSKDILRNIALGSLPYLTIFYFLFSPILLLWNNNKDKRPILSTDAVIIGLIMIHDINNGTFKNTFSV